jgi:hypothetical protein
MALSAPTDEIGIDLGERRLVAGSERAGIVMSPLTVFSQGFSFRLGLRWRSPMEPWASMMAAGEGLPGILPRTGLRIELAVDDDRARLNVPPDSDDGAVLLETDGVGAEGTLDQGVWVSPLPRPDGSLRLAFEWARAGIGRTEVVFDAAEVASAGARSERIAFG